MTLGRREVAGLALRLAFWLPVLFWAAWQWGWHYGHFFLPLYKAVLDMALPDFGVLQFEIGRTHEYVFRAEVIAERLLVAEGRVLPSGFSINVHTPMYIALIHPVVLAAAALVWPGLSWRGRLARLALSVPFLLVLEVLDVPLLLASSINDLLDFSLNPQGDAASRLVDWVHVLDGGGRFALSLAAALATASLHAWLADRLARRSGKGWIGC
jgi:hypothetical protein